MIEGSGFSNVEVRGPVDVFEGASGERRARTYAVYAYTFRAVKIREFRVQAASEDAACEI